MPCFLFRQEIRLGGLTAQVSQTNTLCYLLSKPQGFLFSLILWHDRFGIHALQYELSKANVETAGG